MYEVSTTITVWKCFGKNEPTKSKNLAKSLVYFPAFFWLITKELLAKWWNLWHTQLAKFRKINTVVGKGMAAIISSSALM